MARASLKKKDSLTGTEYLTVFMLMMAAYIAFSMFAVAIEGPEGCKICRLKYYLFGLSLDGNFLFLFVIAPAFLLIPLVVRRDLKLFGVLASGFVTGLVLNDFVWFLINPYFGVGHFNSIDGYWNSPWVKIGIVEFPFFYLSHMAFVLFLWFFFVKNSEETEKRIKDFLE